ncbi:MAG: ABC transporter related protein [Candidatus Parvarchaeum acidiphilum ARMAN-4]|jgi:ABC-2 type transport system ATP-binding protein|uniref:ABC transporter related protein n=1 Tax=Candidatus Parvarchaeum acidiphilum ARMAN-4 TaxID=662760 RepID=D2EGG4_PARA4|nr:MAG: ABC transporter related protein [Candidatus Parvarchaeum acidiphilum ARMAN-4]
MEIKAINLKKSFKNNLALNSISFDIKGKGITGYLGPNGAGKTTTLKILSNLARADSGEAFIDGINIKNYKAALKNVSALVDEPEPYDEMTIYEFLEFIGNIRGMDKMLIENRIKELKKELSLEDLNKKCGQLSKGNRQRVVIASVLLPDTDILLLDEPTSGLDPAEAYDIKKLLKKLKKTKLIILSSHLLDEIKELCDYIILLDKGKIIAQGSVKTIIKKFGRGKGEKGLEKAYINLVRSKT